MDFLKKAAGELQGKSAGGASNTTGAAGGSAPAAGGAAQSSDYGDKAFAAISKKSGHNISSDQGEKITDGLRGAYEKATGSKVDPKYSN
ncbi:hypothetical protein V496_07054 [Pseudogymnoascus sp. VKM F-4515 (FW-2607)]|nr:hypothetical protein V496_07054 [Pseudogymnoascus sp. VKM F-4515 (FW-2607)]KFY96914.1 hypothetical protein V498_02378 [Pseudogymnoascus sp. VKM F-4517 (FW-2822)]